MRRGESGRNSADDIPFGDVDAILPTPAIAVSQGCTALQRLLGQTSAKVARPLPLAGKLSWRGRVYRGSVQIRLGDGTTSVRTSSAALHSCAEHGNSRCFRPASAERQLQAYAPGSGPCRLLPHNRRQKQVALSSLTSRELLHQGEQPSFRALTSRLGTSSEEKLLQRISERGSARTRARADCADRGRVQLRLTPPQLVLQRRLRDLFSRAHPLIGC